MDIIEQDDDILIRADVPRVKKKDLDVSVTNNSITLKGSTSEEKKEEKGEYFHRETMLGSFSRSMTMTLPCDVDSSKAKAKFKDGVLEIVVPKVEKAKRHTVEVK